MSCVVLVVLVLSWVLITLSCSASFWFLLIIYNLNGLPASNHFKSAALVSFTPSWFELSSLDSARVDLITSSWIFQVSF